MSPLTFRIVALALCVLATAAACADSPPNAAVSARGAPNPSPAPPTPTHTPTPDAAPALASTPAPTPAATSTLTPTHTPTPSPTHTPTPAARFELPPTFPSDSRLTQTSLGHSHFCGLREDGRAVCVGSVSKEVDQTAAFLSISSGIDYFCGLRDDGAVSCGGHELYCETCAPEGVFSALSSGKRHACALNADGEAVCWGWDKDGRATPPPGARFSAIAAGGTHSCGIGEFGSLHCWGGNAFGQSEPNEGPFSALALGTKHTCALRTDGSAFCQGNDSHGQASPPPSVFSQIAAGESQTCGITPEGGLECWGIIPVSDHSEKFASVSVGYERICALTSAGAPKCLPRGESQEDPTNGVWLSAPVEMFPLPAGGVAVADQAGYIAIYPPDGGEPRTALDLTRRCCQGSGMLGAALDPDFARFPFIYVYWQPDDVDEFEGRVSRFPMTDGGDIDADGELVILRLPQSGVLHFGGGLRFGADGMMYLGLGEHAETSGAAAPPADLSSLAGKIIRIDIRGATEDMPYRVPPDNPFVGVPDARPEIWALGLRNPWRMSFAPNGDLMVADVGNSSREEVSIAARGANLGWPAFEGSLCVSQDANRCRHEDYAFPIYEYRHRADGGGDCAIIGGMSAPGGGYIFGDYCSGRVWSLERTAPDVWRANEIMDLPGFIIAFGSDADGAVYALNRLGRVTKVSD